MPKSDENAATLARRRHRKKIGKNEQLQTYLIVRTSDYTYDYLYVAGKYP